MDNKKQLYEILSEFYIYEELFKKKSNKNFDEGYLIENDSMEEFKKNIFYDKLRFKSDPKIYTINNFKKDKNIKIYLDKYKGIERNIIQVKFRNGEELKTSLKDNKKYYFINKPLWIKICKNEKIYDKGIPFFFDNNNIVLYLKKNNELLYFKINNGIIEESSFIKNSFIDKPKKNKKDKEEDEIIVNYNNTSLSNHDCIFKIEIEILIRLYYFHKILKEKNNTSSYLDCYNKESVYLINKLWIEKFKNFFEYKELELILDQNSKSSTLYQDKSFIYDSLIEDIISNLPQNYIDKIIEKNKNEFDNKVIEYDYNEVNDNRRVIQYLINNQIISSKIYNLLISLDYNISNQIKAADLYFIENNKLLLLFQLPSQETTEIGYINNENIFIPEFIFYNDKNDISIRNLNTFFSNYFSKFKSNQIQEQIQFSDHNTNIYCYKLNNPMQINDNQNYNTLNMVNFGNINENNDGYVNQQIMKYNNYETNESKIKEIELFDKIKKRIKILLLIYLFEKDIEKKIKNSINSMSGEEYKNFIEEGVGYLINIDWMDNFKNIYLYDKISEYLKNQNSLERINDYEDKIDDIFYNHKTDFVNNFNNDVLYKNEFNIFPKLSKNELYKNILYYKKLYLINSDIYGLLKKNNILNGNYTEVKINYIINNGKIIFKLENNECNNLYIYKQSDNYIFIPEIIVYFHSNKNEMDEQYEEFKTNKNIKYDINNIANKINYINVDFFYLIDTQSKVEVTKITPNNLLDKKYIEFLLNIYLTRKDIENKTNRSLINACIEKYSIIKKESMNEILNFFEYNNFIVFIKQHNIDKNEEKILDEIMNKFHENEYLMNLDNKVKALHTLKSNKKISENNEIDYNSDDIEIINDKVKNFINELFGNIYIEDRIFLFGDQKIIMDYKFVKNCLIIGNFENNTFKPEIMLNFAQKKYPENYFSIIQTKGYNNFINELNLNNNFIITSENKKIKEIKEIKIDDNNIVYSIANNNNEGRDNIQSNHHVNNGIQNNSLPSSNNNQNLIKSGENDNSIKGINEIQNTNKNNESSKNINEPGDDGSESHHSNLLENVNGLNLQNNILGTDIEAGIFTETNKEEAKILNEEQQETPREFSDNNNIKKFIENQIKALILYYFFYLELEKDVKSSNINIKNSECYLISKDWMNKFKEFYLYEKLVENIKKIMQQLNLDTNSENIDKIIYNKLDKKYIEKVNGKEDEYSDFFEDKNNITYNIEKAKDEEFGEIQYYYGFGFISDNVYNLIRKIKNNSSFDLIKKEYLINDNKIIIKFEEKLLVGHFDFSKHQYISELFLYYYDDKDLIHYEYLKSNHYNKFIKENITDNKHLIKGGSPIYIGKIIELNNQNNEILESNENKINNEITPSGESQKSLSLQSKNNIEFLLRLHFYYKSFKERFNNPNYMQNLEKGYIIDKDLIEKYKKYYNYNELKKFCESKTIDVKSIEEFENSIETLRRSLSNEYFKEINKKDNDPSQKVELCNDNQITDQNLYPDNCVILNEKLNNILYNHDENIQRKKNKIEILYFIGDKKLIIIYNNYINIGNIDDNCVFKLENKFHYNTYEELNNIINEIKNEGVSNFKDNFNQDFNGPKNLDKIMENNFNNKPFLTKNNDKSKIFNDKNISNEKNISTTPGVNINIINSDFYFMNLNIENMNKTLKIILSIIIDSEKIKYKMKMPLNSGNSNEYCLLNYDWFKKYLELNNAENEVYEYLVNSVKNCINISNINNKKQMLINKIVPLINSSIKMKIKEVKDNYHKLRDNKLINVDSSTFTIKGNNELKYYYNFIIISSETMDSLKKDFPFHYGKNLILLGDNKAFIKRKSQFIIEIGSINNKNIFIPEFFFYFDKESILKNNLNLLQIDGYEQYINQYLLFNNDFSSPIFDKQNDSIGYAFKYDPSIKDYSIYQINEQLKTLIQLYFSHAQLKNLLNSNKLLVGKFLIFDKKYIQKILEIFDYNNLEKELNNNAIVKQIMNVLETKNNNIFLDDKKVSLIIKNLPEDINTNYNKKKFNNQKIECQEEPNLIPFNNDGLFYYNNLEIVDKSIYGLLSGFNINSSLYEEKENYLECIIIEKYILLNISKNYSKCTLEVCTINDDNNINPLYLLEYDNGKECLKHINYVKSLFGVKNFFESLDFTSNNRIEMNDENDLKIGIIYNLGLNKNVNTISPSINNQNLNKISNEGNFQKPDNSFKSNMDKIPLDNYSGSKNINQCQKKLLKGDTLGILNQKIPQLSYDQISNKKKDANNPVNNPQVDNNNHIKSILECFAFPPKIGLQNVGATCYMNATLQCFCNILHFVDYFKFNPKVEETINRYEKQHELCLTSSFKILIDNLWPKGNNILSRYCGKNSNNTYFIPQEFKKKISNMDDLFKGVAANDSKDLVNFIIMTLHEELNEIPKANNNQNNRVNNQNINQYNNAEVFQYFINNFQKENSIISKEFYAVNHTLTKCSKCQLIKNNYQTYFFLIFRLEEIRKYKLDQSSKQIMNMCQNMFKANAYLFQQNLQKMQNTNSVTLEDCFNYNEKIDTFQGENAMYCNLCKVQANSFYQTKLFSGPEILIMVLNRGKGIEFKVKLELDLYIDITNYIEIKVNKGWKYELIGVVTHLGESGASGHFIAYCKSPIGGGWYQYNDELVFEVKDFAKEIRDYAMPYILFYQKINE